MFIFSPVFEKRFEPSGILAIVYQVLQKRKSYQFIFFFLLKF